MPKHYATKLSKGTMAMLAVQFVLTIALLALMVYLLDFVISHQLGGWMIASYVFIILSVLAIIIYGVYAYRRGDIGYRCTLLPFLSATLINTIMPGRAPIQIALLAILFALTFTLIIDEKNEKESFILLSAMVLVSVGFSVYSAITANTKFLGDVASNWATYVAMYSSIALPTITSVTYLVAYKAKIEHFSKDSTQA
ncbi:MAG: hypothetical protein IJS52_08495 [Bacilli bacterium]|nr:hypothetical protein [Bacilli bacterium]